MNLSISTLLRALACAAIVFVWLPVFNRPRGSAALAFAVSAALIFLMVAHARWLKAASLRVIRDHPFPAFLSEKVRAAHPELGRDSLPKVERGLRQFFLASAQANGQFVAMPSKVVDTLWHEFILHTRGYEVFCRKAFGRILHHTPAEALPLGATKRGSVQSEGLRRAWYWSCKDEGIDPKRPSRLPVLFALDGAMGIAGGYVYAADCSRLGADRGDTHCASAIGCGSSCGSGGGSDSHSSSSDGGDAGGGDGGGGGCGGGGD